MHGYILVVDDKPSNVKLVSFLLTRKGYAVRSAMNADEALDRIAEELPRLILMDIQLPGMDGLMLTHKLKVDPRTKHIFIVAFTAYAMKGDKEKMLDAGCDAYISKPIDTRALPDKVAEFLAQAEANGGH